MARPLRIDIEGGWYHVTARGTERRSIFSDEMYCVHFLELLKRMSERYGVEVHAYCLMAVKLAIFVAVLSGIAGGGHRSHMKD